MEQIEDPQRWFHKYLGQYGLKGMEGGKTSYNPQTAGEFEAAAKRLNRMAAQGRTLKEGLSYESMIKRFGKSYSHKNYEAFLASSGGERISEIDRLVSQFEQGAALERLGGQVYAGAPGEFTSALGGFDKAIAQQQSLGGTYYSEAGAAQAAAGHTGFLGQAKAALASPIDAATALQSQGIGVLSRYSEGFGVGTLNALPQYSQLVTGGSSLLREISKTPQQQVFLRGPMRGQSIYNRPPSRGINLKTAARPQTQFTTIGER